MSESKLNRLTVLGGGVLGGQIAWHSAFKGKQVVVYDLHSEGLDNCRAAQLHYAGIYAEGIGASDEVLDTTRQRLTFTNDLAAAVAEADLVIEAVPEIPEVKTATYREMAQLLPAHTLVATNSSTLLPSQFADDTGRPDKYCALHFANLIWSANLAEVMAHPGTHPDTVLAVTRFAIEIGMVPLALRKEQNGYLINSLLVPLANAALSLDREGVASHEDVDRAFMIGNRGVGAGPFGVMDIVGMTTIYNILSYWGALNDDAVMSANARHIKERFLDQGKLGLPSGEGYYRYPQPAFQSPDFLAVPELSKAEELARLVG